MKGIIFNSIFIIIFMFSRYNVMFADLCILSFNGFSKLISTIYFFKRITKLFRKRKVYNLKSRHAYLPSFQINRCIYDNKHASKQISWIDEFQNEKDIQLSLVNIVPFLYRAALLHWL